MSTLALARLRRTAPLLVAALGCLALPARAQESNLRTFSWGDHPAIVEAFEALPVQDGGRVKPMHTFAGFTLLRLHGKRSLKTPLGEKLTPVEWLLDTLCFPEMAADYPLFIVQNDEVTRSLDLSFTGKRKRDLYSMNELRPGISKLFELAREYSPIEPKERSAVEEQIVNLAGNVNVFLMLSDHLDPVRHAIDLPADETVRELFDGRASATFEEVLGRMGTLGEAYRRLTADASAAGSAEFRAVAGLLQGTADLVSGSNLLAMIPPADPEREEWRTPHDLFYGTFEGEELAPQHRAMLAELGGMVRARSTPEGLLGHLTSFRDASVALAEGRGEFAKVPLELRYYKLKLLYAGLILYVLSFLLMSFLWLRPRSRTLYRLTWATALVPTLLVCVAIAMRCVIRGRPPVSTLYETVLFVTAVGALVALFLEAVNRQKIALSAAAILGTVGLFIANGYENLDKQDTMPALVAVLDTNFWLATHVTTITIGYSAGMLAALLASVYLVAKLVGWKRDERAFYHSLGRMVYGVLCFALLFSLVGTILGGIWANDSWGRFWGWDPKENGALLICISNIVILHARMGGYLREHGVCMAAAFGGTVVAFSWWGVNLLGVGLHSYGFTQGIHRSLWTYYFIQWGIMGLGAVAWWLERARASRPAVARPRAQLGPLDGEAPGRAT